MKSNNLYDFIYYLWYIKYDRQYRLNYMYIDVKIIRIDKINIKNNNIIMILI